MKSCFACHAVVPPQAIEHAFKNETIGLVTKAEFMQKRATLQERRVHRDTDHSKQDA